MKKLIITAASIAMALTSATAQMSDLVSGQNSFQVVGAGARIGMGSLMQDGPSLSKGMGVNAAVDGVYSYYFNRKSKTAPFFGIRTGLAVAYTQNTVSMDEYNNTFKIQDKDIELTYNITARSLEEKNRQLSVEVPIMASMIHKQLFFNLGLRVGVPVVPRYNLTFADPSTSVKVEKFGVTAYNASVFGVVSADQTDVKGKLDAANFNMSIAFEGGYTFTVGDNWLGVGLYVDYGVLNNFSGGDGRMINVDVSTINPSNNVPAKVTVESMTKTLADKIGNFDIGVRAFYSWPKIKSGKH